MLITSSAERNAKYRREQELKRAMFALGNPTVDQKYITDFGNSASKFISDSAKGVSGVAFGQSQQALDRYNAQAQRLKYQKLVIEDFLERNAEKDSYTELQNAPNNIQKGIDNVGNAYINTHNMMSQYKTEDEYNRDKITSQHISSTYDEILAEINRLGEEQKKQTPEQAAKTQKSRDVLNNLLYNNNYIDRDSYQKAIADIDRQIAEIEKTIGKLPVGMVARSVYDAKNGEAANKINYLKTLKSTLEEKEKITEFTELPAKLGEHNFQIGVSNGKIKGQYNPTADQLKQWVQKYADSSYDEQTKMLDEKPEIVDPLGFVEQNPDLWAQEGQNSRLSNIFLTEIYNHAKEYHWDEITPEEKDIYYFTLNRLGKDKAMEYLSLLERHFGQRYAADITKSIEEFTDKAGWLGGTFINIALIPVSMIGNAEAALIGFRDYVSGEGINPYSSANRLRLSTTAIRSGTAKEWGKAADWELFGKNVFEQSFNILMSTGESLFGGLALGPAYMFFAGSGAAMSTAQDIYDRGGSANQVFFGALASGIAEAVFEKISIDRLLSGAESITGFKEMFKQILIQGGVEASEEVLTEMANTISDNLIMAEKSTVNLRVKELIDENPSMTPTEARKKAETEVVTEVIWAGLSGFISGGLNIGVMGTTGIVANKFDQKKQSVATQQIIGNQLKSDGTAEAFVNFAISQGLVKDGTTVDSLSSEALGKVYQDFCDKFYETASKSKTSTELLSVVEKYNTEETPNVVKRYVGAVTATVLAEHPEWAPETSEATTVDDSADGVEAAEESVLPNVSAVAPEADPIKDDAFAARGLERLTEEQRFLKSIGETLGRKVEFRNLDKWVKDPETGKRRRVSPGGMINKTTGVLYLNSSKYANQNALREVLKHEITHFAEVDTEAYALLQKGIMDSQVFKDWVKRKGYKGTVNEDGYAVSATSNMNAAYIKRYAESGLEGTEVFKGTGAEDAANREMVADFVAENLFTDDMSRLRDALSDVQPETVNKFKQWILDLLKKLKNAFRSQAKVYESIEGIESEFVKVCKSAQRIWEQNHKQTAEQQKTSTESGGQYSIRKDIVDLNGKEYETVVELDKPISKRTLSEPKRFFNYIKSNLLGLQIPVEDALGNLEIVEFAAENETTTKNGKSHPVLGELKYIRGDIRKLVVANFKEVAEESSYDQKLSTNNNDHGWLDKNGWESRKTYVLQDGVIYEAYLRIAKASDGRNILYSVNLDINNGIAVDMGATNKRAAVIAAMPSSFRVSQNTKNVKQNLSADTKGVAENDEDQHSLPTQTDSDGRQLSEGQQEYFKDSKARDDNGNLKVMYQGAQSEFYKFDRKKSSPYNLYGRGFYFTDSKSHANQYGTAREYYLNIKNPVPTSKEDSIITREQMRKYLEAVAENEDDYDIWNYGTTDIDVILDKVFDGRSDFAMLQDVNATAIGDLVAAIELFNEINGTDFDGIILATETVIFNSEQAKLTSNTEPTTDPDIRYSLPQEVEEEYMSAVESGDTEAQSRLVEFAAKNAGYVSKALHGTPNFGFTILDVSKSDDKMSFFATDSFETASTYSPSEGARRIGNAARRTSSQEYQKQIDAIKSDVHAYAEHLKSQYDIDISEFKSRFMTALNEQFKSATKTGIDAFWETSYLLGESAEAAKTELYNRYQNDPDNKKMSFKRFENSEYWQSVVDDNNTYFERITDNLQNLFMSDDVGGVYELYANTDGHLVIDCNGRNWNNIKSDALPWRGVTNRWTTRSVVQYAKDNGYTGVTFKNLRDSGNDSNIKPATVYAFFNPQQQLKSADPVTYDDEGNVIPLSERFNPQNEDLRYSLPIEEQYDNAVKSDNKAEMQRLVDIAAEAAMPDSVVRDKNGKLLKMYHGTARYGFTKFITQSFKMGLFGDGAYFTDNKDVADSYQSKDDRNSYGKGTYSVYLNITNPMDMDAEANAEEWSKQFPEAKQYGYFDDTKTNEEYFKAVNQYLIDEKQSESDRAEMLRNALEDMGYDGITHIGGGRFNSQDGTKHRVYIAFNPEQIKNNEPVSYDNAHFPIPLSQRFDLNKEDYRYSLPDNKDRLLEMYEAGQITKEQLFEALENKPQKENPASIAKLKPEDASTTPELKKKTGENKGDSESKFYESAMKSSIFDESFKDDIQDDTYVQSYNRITNKETLKKAADMLDEGGQAGVTAWFAKPLDTVSLTDIAMGLILMDRYQRVGDYQSAAAAAQRVRMMGTSSGQQVQIFSILGRFTPEGMVYYAQKELDQAYQKFIDTKAKKWAEKNADKFKLTPEDIEKIRRNTLQATALPEDSRARAILLAEICSLVQNKIPPTAADSLRAWQRIAMLLNVRTNIRNILGNAGMVPVFIASDFFGTFVDKAIARTTGMRTTGNFSVKGSGKAFAKGFYESLDDFRRDVHTRQEELNRFELDGFKGREAPGKNFDANTKSAAWNKMADILNGLDRFTSFCLEAGDRTFFEMWVNNSLNNQMRLNNVTEPTPEMLLAATEEALQRTWQDNSQMARVVSKLKQTMNIANIGGYGLGDVLVKFTKTPANIAKAIVDFSPVGFIFATKNIVQVRQAFEKGQLTPAMQNKAVKSMSNAITGTLIYLLVTALASAGVIKLSGDSDDDKDVSNFERYIVGIPPYSIEFFGVNITYDWMQPFGSVLAIVSEYMENKKDKSTGWGDDLVQAVMAGGEVFTKQSFLQSLYEFFSNSDENFIMGLSQAVASDPSVFIPQLISQTASIIDPKRRMTYDNNFWKNSLNQVISKIPGLRMLLPEQVNVMGETIENNQFLNPWLAFVAPYNTYPDSYGKTAEKIYDLYRTTGDKEVIPRSAPKNFSVKGHKYSFTQKQKQEFQRDMGQASAEMLDIFFKSKEYQKLNDAQKVDVIKSIYGYSTKLAKFNVVKKDYDYALLSDIIGYKDEEETQPILTKSKYDSLSQKAKIQIVEEGIFTTKERALKDYNEAVKYFISKSK